MEHRERSWWKKKVVVIPLLLVLLVAGLAFFAEPLILKKANQMAKTMNPEFTGHVKDLDISFLRGAVVLQDVRASLKKNEREFFQVDEVLVDLAWRELFKGNILFDVGIRSFNLKFAKDIAQAGERLPKAEKKEAKRAFKIAHIDVYDSSIALLDFPGMGNDKHLKVKNIHGSVRNLSQEKGSELATYDINARLTDKDKIKVTGNIDMTSTPPRWDANTKWEGFHLNSLNSAIRKKLAFNWKNGTLNLYSEAKSEGGKVYGYVKPIMHDVEYVGNKDEWKGPGHFFLEIAGTVANWVFERDKPNTVATRVPFIYHNGAFSLESGEGIAQAVEHGLLEEDKVKPGIENKYRLNRRNPAEVQAQEEDLKEAKEDKKEKAEEERKKD